MTGMIVSHTFDDYLHNGHVQLIERSIVAETPTETLRFKREVVKVPDVVVMVPEWNGFLAVLNQYRAPLNRWINEFPAGAIEEGESPLEGAKRELREETDLESDEWIELGTFSSSEGYSTEQATLFLARNCRVVKHGYVRKEEEAHTYKMYVDYKQDGHRFHGAKGQLAYELARPILLEG